jgi:hypothetical protein
MNKKIIGKSILVLIAILTYIFFYTVRNESQYIVSNQSDAKIDAEYYKYLIQNKIMNYSEISELSPNNQTIPFLYILYTLNKIGLMNEFIYTFTFSIIIILYINNIQKKYNLNQIAFTFTLLPIFQYAILPTKETFVLISILAILSFNKNTSSIYKIFVYLILLSVRPIMAVIVLVSKILENKILRLRFQLFIILNILIYIINRETILMVATTYQDANINFQGSSCMIGFLNLCINTEDIKEVKYLLRFVIWFILRIIKGIIDQRWIFEAENYEYFEILNSILIGIASIVTLKGIIVKNYKNKIYENRILIIILFYLGVFAGSFLFFQTQRIYLIVLPLAYIAMRGRNEI